MEIVPLHPDLDAHSVVKALRNIADSIEKGEYDFDPNLAVVVLARETQLRSPDGTRDRYSWQTHGLGEKASVFMVRGILGSALANMSTPENG